MGCALYETLGLDCWSGPRCGDCPSLEEFGDDPVNDNSLEAEYPEWSGVMETRIIGMEDG